MKTYIGIQKPCKAHPKGNLDTIWIQQPDGKYRCDKLKLTLEEWAIESDVKNGYLKAVVAQR